MGLLDLFDMIGASRNSRAMAAAAQEAARKHEHQAFVSHMLAQGWRSAWLPDGIHPRQFDVVEIRREEWPNSELVRWATLHPAMNVNGLWWRPWQGQETNGKIVDAEATEVPADQKLIAPPQ